MTAGLERKLEILLEVAIAAMALLAVAMSGLGTALLLHTLGLPFLVGNTYGDRLPPLAPALDSVRVSMRPVVLAGILVVMAGLGSCTVHFGERDGTRWQWHWQPVARYQRVLAVALGVALVILLEAMFLVGTGYGPSDPRNDFRWELLWSVTAQMEAGVVVAVAVVGRLAWRRLRGRWGHAAGE
jgi:hypothetical protein